MLSGRGRVQVAAWEEEEEKVTEWRGYKGIFVPVRVRGGPVFESHNRVIGRTRLGRVAERLGRSEVSDHLGSSQHRWISTPCMHVLQKRLSFVAINWHRILVLPRNLQRLPALRQFWTHGSQRRAVETAG